MKKLNLKTNNLTLKRNIYSNNFTNKFNKALLLQNSGEFGGAIKIYKELIINDPNRFETNINIGKCYFGISDFNNASFYFHKLHELDSDNLEVLIACSVTYLNLNNIDLAIKFFKKIVLIDPSNVDAWVNLTYASNLLMNNTDALYYATQALSLNPKESRLFNNMGSALIAFHRYKDASICFDTAIELDPNDINPLSNKAALLDKIGNHEESINEYNKILSKVKPESIEEIETQFKKSFPLLQLGNLKEGWECHEYGFKINNIRARNPQRKFTKPRWTGESIIGKRLLVWREQGLGDEVLYFSLLESVFPLCDNIIVECTDRLIPLFRRSFNNCIVREDPGVSEWLHPTTEDFDFQIPVGSLCKIFRSNWDNFHKSNGYLKANYDIVAKFNDELREYSKYKLIGISWRSGNLKEERNIHYTSLTDWISLLRLPNCKFVNLQYGDTTNEIENLRSEFNIDIIDFNTIDLKNDLESLAGLICNLDYVISISSFAGVFAPALGVKTKLLAHKGWDLLGKNKYPWFSNVDLILSPNLNTPLNSLITIENFNL